MYTLIQVKIFVYCTWDPVYIINLKLKTPNIKVKLVDYLLELTKNLFVQFANRTKSYKYRFFFFF